MQNPDKKSEVQAAWSRQSKDAEKTFAALVKNFSGKAKERRGVERDSERAITFERVRRLAELEMDGAGGELEKAEEKQQDVDFAQTMRNIPHCADRESVVRAGRERENWHNSHAFGGSAGLRRLSSIARAAAAKGGCTLVPPVGTGEEEDASSEVDAAPSVASTSSESSSASMRGTKRAREGDEAMQGDATGKRKGRPTPVAVRLLSHAAQEVLYAVLSAAVRVAQHGSASGSAVQGQSRCTLEVDHVRFAVAAMPPSRSALVDLLPRADDDEEGGGAELVGAAAAGGEHGRSGGSGGREQLQFS